MTREYDLVIVGAGPAGLSAAVQADALGLSVVLIDESMEPGGQIYRSIETVAKERREFLKLLGTDYKAGAKLARAFRQSGCEYLPGRTVWRLDTDGRVALNDNRAATTLKGRHVLVSTGAYERACAIPGWTIPGVMTAGAAQVLLKSGGVTPAGPIAVVGCGPLLLLVASQLIAAGANVSAVIETTSVLDYIRALPMLPRALKAMEYLIKGLRMRRTIKRAGVPMVSGASDLAVHGDVHVSKLTYRAGNRTCEIKVQTVLLHVGVVPNVQATRTLECEHIWMERERYWRPATNEWGQCSVEAVYVAGDCAGIVGAKASEVAGQLAVLDIACRQDRLSEAERDTQARPLRRALNHQRAIRPFLDILFSPPPESFSPPDDTTVVCRCEEVTAGEIREAVALGCRGPNQLKAFTRCGMGPCQGRMCGLTVSEIIADTLDVEIPAVGYYRIRPPIKPVTLEQLAAME